MKNKTVDSSSKWRKLWRKVPTIASLYQYKPNGMYYVRAKIKGKAISRSLETTDLATAKRLVASEKEKEATLSAEGGKLPFVEVVERYRISRNGLNQATIKSAISNLKKYPAVGNLPVRDVDHETLARYFSTLKLSPSYNNQQVATLKAALALAVARHYISEQPIKKIEGQRRATFNRPVKRTMPRVPTVEQFEAIREQIKGNKRSDTAIAAWELLSFCGMFGCYEAEARFLDWSHIDVKDWKAILLQRQKTGHLYKAPIYPYAKSFLQELWKSRGEPTAGKVFSIGTVKRSLDTACKKLGYPHFTILNFRQMFVCRLLWAGVSIKNVSKWIGHQDGGAQVMELYSEVITDMDTAQRDADVAKLVPKEPEPAKV